MLAFLSQAQVEPDLTIEIFLMDGPLVGFGALELVDPPSEQPRERRQLAALSSERRTGGDAAQCHQRMAQFSTLSFGVAASVNDSAAGKPRGRRARLSATRIARARANS